MEKLLEIKNLCVRYSEDTDILKDVSLDIFNGEILGIVGESGSGKTTLIRSINNMLPESAKINGEILFSGTKLFELNKKEWKKVRGNEISMIFQNPGTFFNPIQKIGTQIVEIIRYHKKIKKSKAKKIALESLELMNFPDVNQVMSSYPFQLSGGMIQRVAIAMAYVLEPKVILADEPTSALDVIVQKKIVEELMLLRDRIGTTIIIVTHNIGCAAYMADRVAVMKDGNFIECGETKLIINTPKEDYTKDLFNSLLRLKDNNKENNSKDINKKCMRLV